MDFRAEKRSRLTVAGVLLLALLQFGFFFIKETTKDLFFGRISAKLVDFAAGWGVTEATMVEWLSSSFSFLVSAGLAFFLVWMSYRLGKEKVLAETKPKANHPEATPQRHYSARDRDNIADLFQELRTILDKDASALHGELMRLQFTWPQLPRKTPSDPLNFETTIKRLKLIRNDAALLDNHIFTEWPKRNKGYDNLLKAIIAFRKPNVFSDLRHCCDRVIPAAESAHSAYVKAPNQTHQMAVIMGAIVEPLVVRTAGLNGWLADTERRIDEQEKLILNRS